MCGIAGVVEADRNARVDENILRRMCAAMVHRGPDDEGVYTAGRVGLGMRRLSIIDVAAGHQPISNEDDTSPDFSSEIQAESCIGSRAKRVPSCDWAIKAFPFLTISRPDAKCQEVSS